MRVRLQDWSQQDTPERFRVLSSLEKSDLDALLQHGRNERIRPFEALVRLVADFLTFCRWRAEIHLTGHRLGPVYRPVFQRPRPASTSKT
ncbi:MAG: hypothetical protein EBS77_07435 [Gammaproteobacteria bacterium]|nr:hypothetical protein [Gammaproteobacteria bacterium]